MSGDHTPTPEARAMQPWLHHLVVAVDGPMTSLAAADGRICSGAEGIYLDDVRIVSRFEVGIDGGLSQVASAAVGNGSEFLSSARALGDAGADPSVELHHRRELTAPDCRDTITVRSRAAAPVDATLTVTLAADGLDISAVKHGDTAGTPVATTLTDDTASWDTAHHHTVATFDPAPESVRPQDDGTVLVSYPLHVAPGAETAVTVHLSTRRTGTTLLDADSGSGRLAFSDAVRAQADDPRVEAALDIALRDVEHLALTDPLDPADVFLAAGSPWYLTLFGRDSIWAARMLLPLGTDLALGTLRTLARRQGRQVDESIAEQPGKIPHEIRRGTGDHQLPPVYFGTVDATALWVCLLDEALDWGLPDVAATELLPALRGALTWLTEYAAPDADGLIKYVDRSGTGLVNQGWKDSGDSIRFRDGRIADAPIALIEAQAYAVQAARAGAAILRRLGTPNDAKLAEAAERQAVSLAGIIRDHFWVEAEDRRWPAIAVDGHGAPVSGIASNMGHCLTAGVFDEDEARTVADTLLAPSMTGRYGIRTFADDNGGFNPIGYHTGSVWIHDTAICALGLADAGFAAEVDTVTRSMLEATAHFGFRSPELHGDRGVLGRPVPYPASCRPQAWSAAATIAMLTAALGLRCDARNRTLTVRPGSTAFGAVRLDGLRVAGTLVTLEVDRDGSARATDLPDGWTLERG